MHPIHRLLDPHFKDTMHTNALARITVLKAGGIFEKSLYSGEASMELSSSLYKEWRFDEQSLPGDLVKRYASGIYELGDLMSVWYAENVFFLKLFSMFGYLELLKMLLQEKYFPSKERKLLSSLIGENHCVNDIQTLIEVVNF